MLDQTVTAEQQEAIQYAIAVLKEAGIDARLTELWNGGEKRLTIMLKNIENINQCPHGDNWDDCPDCRH